jgi:hypothetical protein
MFQTIHGLENTPQNIPPTCMNKYYLVKIEIDPVLRTLSAGKRKTFPNHCGHHDARHTPFENSLKVNTSSKEYCGDIKQVR